MKQNAYLKCAEFSVVIFLFLIGQTTTSDCPKFSNVKRDDSIAVIREFEDAERIAITSKNYKFNILLRQTKSLLSQNFSTSYFQNGNKLTFRRKDFESVSCNYQGAIEGCANSSVAVNICDGIRGVVTAENVTLVLSPTSSDDVAGGPKTNHVLRLTDEKLLSMKHDSLPFIGKKNQGRIRREVQNGQTLFVELILVADHSEFLAWGSVDAVVDRFITLVNIADSVMQQLRIRLVLYHIEVWNEEDMITVDGPTGETLSQFQVYRRMKIANSTEDNPWKITDNAQLIVDLASSKSLVGNGYIDGMCSSHSVAVVRDFSVSSAEVALTMAHEMGHNFGMSHDDTSDCECPNVLGCVMATLFSGQTTWSNCSTTDLQTFLQRRDHSCLLDIPEAHMILTDPVCGNQIVEMGEECDCGVPDVCESNCCNAVTCELHGFAECYEDLCCDDVCKFVAEATECRPSGSNECDLPEYCTGTSGQCPMDRFVLEGTNCPEGSCLSGLCLSRDQICKEYWGSEAKESNQVCYSLNKRGDLFGNCGKDFDGNFIACSESDKFCGTLHCTFDDILTFHTPINRGGGWRAFTIFISNELCLSLTSGSGDVAFDGLVLDGTSCGNGQICENAKCISALMDSTSCEDLCNARGVCNDFGHCHCDVGWDPPYCNVTGVGGSLDSGPAAVISPHIISVNFDAIVVDFDFGITISAKDQISTQENLIDPIEVPVGSKFTTNVQKPANTKSKILECWETSSQDPASTMLVETIQDGCPMSGSNLNETEYSAEITTIVDQDFVHEQHVYVHCSYQVCVNGDEDLCEICKE